MTQLTIGELLRRHRLDASLTQKELADMIGYHNAVVSRVETESQQPTAEYLERLIEVLSLSPDQAKEVWTVYQGDSDTPIVQAREDWGEAPDVGIFYGRYEDLTRLTQWLVTDHCRLTAVLGMGGIGKTALVTKLAKQTADKFDYVIWRSLRNAPPLTEILTECIQFLSDQQDIDLPENTDKLITRFIKYLDEQHCLVVMDNIEAILQKDQAGHYRDGYEEYGYLFQRVGEGDHQSCLLLTSREKPREVGRLEGAMAPVRSHELSGLGLEEGQQMLTGKGLSGSDEAWTALVRYYSGNPLALNLVAEMIREVYDGDIDDFLAEGEVIFGRIGDVIGEQLERLSTLEQSLMYWLAIERESVSREVLLDNLVQPVSRRELMVALRSLRRRSLIEKSGTDFTLQNVVMEYVTDRLIEQVCAEVTTEVNSTLQSHALIKAQAKDYIRDSQTRLILKPVADTLLTTLGKEDVENRLRRILSIVQQVQPQKPGYAPGNVLNLLVQLGSDLSSFDFSDLIVWQAYLRGRELHDVNFSHADLARSVFTETFGGIISVAFSPDGELLAAGTANGEIRLWQVADGKPLLTHKGHADWVRSVAFSPDSRTLVSGSNDKTVRLWNVSTNQCLKTLRGHTGRVRSVTFSPNGQMLASGSLDRTVRLWDANTGQCLKTLRGHIEQIRSVAFSPDGQMLASGSFDQTVRLWEANTGQCVNILQGHTKLVWSVAFNTDGNSLASGSYDKTVRLWDVNTGQCLKILRGHTDSARTVVFSPNGRTLASGSEDRTVRLWDVSTGQCLKTLTGHTDRVWSVAFSPDGGTLASGSRDQAVRLWDTSTGQCLRTLQGYTNPAWSVTFDPTGRMLASSSLDQVVRLWDVHTGQCLKTLQGHSRRVWSVAFSPDGDTLASCSRDRTIRLWDVSTGQCFKMLLGPTRWVSSVIFSPNGRILASSSDDHLVRLWDVSTGQCLKTLQGHTERPRSVAFSPDGEMLASGSFDQTVRLWDVSTGQCLKTLQGHTDQVTSVAFSPNGSILASSSEDQTVRLWDIDTGQCLKTLKQHVNAVWRVTLSPDGRMLASSGSDQTVRLWDVNTGQCLKTLQGHTGWIWSVSFDPDGHTLASCSDDETIKLWNTKTGECLKTLRPDRPYERMNITGVTGLNEAQKATLKALGAVDYSEHPG